VHTREIISSQYAAALEMLRRAVDKCPDELWADNSYRNEFWHIAYHALFYAHFYLQESSEAFTPWKLHRKDYNFLGPTPWPPHKPPDIGEPYTKAEVLEYLQICRNEVRRQVPLLDLDAASGFDWLPFDKLELQFYNIRHIQHHAAQLIDRLRNTASIGVDWVGSKRQI
jgi:hypothetical protein